jgi:hypothetical protein
VIHRTTLILLAATLACLAVAGCGPRRPETVPVTGTVMLDGSPVERAGVGFHPQFTGGVPATGTTDAEGRFTLRTFQAGDGAMPGPHRVSVSLQKTTGVVPDPDGLSGEIAPEGLRVEWIVPEKYSNPETSGLEVEVRPGMDAVPLELTAK